VEQIYINYKSFKKRPSHFIKSPFRYPGGKYYALKYILPFLESVSHDEYREPFVGGGNVFFAKTKAPINWINDLESNIIDVYKAFSNKKTRNKLMEIFSKEHVSRERHNEIKQIVPNNQIDGVFKTFYLNRTSYSGIINAPAWGYAEGKSSPPSKWSGFIEPAGNKLEDVKITNLDFEEVIKAPAQGKKVLLYLDPPYFYADQKRAYSKSFKQEDHIRLSKILSNTSYLFCLSYDDCEEIRKLYEWAEINQCSWLYNTANCSGKQRKMGNELIITNYKLTLPLGFE